MEAILDALEWLGIDFDEIPNIKSQNPNKFQISNSKYQNLFFQSDRLEVYKKYALELVAGGAAYVCTCTEERLTEVRAAQTKAGLPPKYDGHCRDMGLDYSPEKSVIRLKTPDTGQTSFHDLIRGQVSFENALIDDQVLLKSDGYPTYHLANVVDDHEMAITHVLRAEEWLSSTPKHILLYMAFGWPAPEFAHLPMILGSDKSKLSKRHGAVAASEYQRQGYLPEAMINFLSLLGWHPGNDQEFFSRAELIKEFSLDRVQKSAAVFDQQKLDWLNSHYLRGRSNSDLAGLIKKHYQKQEPGVNDYLDHLLPLQRDVLFRVIKERLNKLGDFSAAIQYFRELPDYAPPLLIFRDTPAATIKARLTAVSELLGKMDDDQYQPEFVNDKIMALITEHGWKVGEVLHPLRVSLTGLKDSAGPFEVASILGRPECQRRINIGLDKLAKI